MLFFQTAGLSDKPDQYGAEPSEKDKENIREASLETGQMRLGCFLR